MQATNENACEIEAGSLAFFATLRSTRCNGKICLTCLFSIVFKQINPTNQSVSSYSSNPSTPVSSPPPLTGSAPGWVPGAAPVSPHFTADPNRGTIHMVCIKASLLTVSFFFLFFPFFFLSICFFRIYLSTIISPDTCNETNLIVCWRNTRSVPSLLVN